MRCATCSRQSSGKWPRHARRLTQSQRGGESRLAHASPLASLDPHRDARRQRHARRLTQDRHPEPAEGRTGQFGANPLSLAGCGSHTQSRQAPSTSTWQSTTNPGQSPAPAPVTPSAAFSPPDLKPFGSSSITSYPEARTTCSAADRTTSNFSKSSSGISILAVSP